MTCPSNPNPPPTSSCPQYYGRINRVRFHPDSKRVYDEKGNYLGHGELINEHLVITPKALNNEK